MNEKPQIELSRDKIASFEKVYRVRLANLQLERVSNGVIIPSSALNSFKIRLQNLRLNSTRNTL